MSDTPETDAAAVKNIYGVASEVDVDFARRLERERDEARKDRDQLKEALLIMESLLKPGVELFPEIGQFLKGGIK